MFSLEGHISTLGFPCFFPILFCFVPMTQEFELFVLKLVGSFFCLSVIPKPCYKSFCSAILFCQVQNLLFLFIALISLLTFSLYSCLFSCVLVFCTKHLNDIYFTLVLRQVQFSSWVVVSGASSLSLQLYFSVLAVFRSMYIQLKFEHLKTPTSLWTVFQAGDFKESSHLDGLGLLKSFSSRHLPGKLKFSQMLLPLPSATAVLLVSQALLGETTQPLVWPSEKCEFQGHGQLFFPSVPRISRMRLHGLK